MNDANSSGRNPVCDGAALRRFRQSRGWTQESLAEASGYSKRLIQKAESGGSLSPATLGELAEALSNGGEPVSIDALIATPQSVIEEFIAIINEHTAEAGPAAAHLIADDFRLWCAGDPEQMPFAGEWRGLEGLTQFCHRFFEVICPSPDGLIQDVRYLSSGPVVVVWAQGVADVRGMSGEMPVVWLNHRYEVHGGKITLYENHFDTRTGGERIAEAKARQLLGE